MLSFSFTNTFPFVEKQLSITQRPIHCTDVKNSKWMINDAKIGCMEDNWV